MANVKITDLAAYTDPASTDVLPIVDVGADVTKKVSIADLLENAGSGTASLPGIAFDGDPNTGIYSPGADQVAISTGGTGRLFVDASGNVGLGNGSPGAKLEVVGGTTQDAIAAHIKAGNGLNTVGLVVDSDAEDSDILIKARSNTSATPTDADTKFIITGPGKVGIGTTSPGGALEIDAAAATSPFIAKINTSEVFRITSSGQLLVGTSSNSQVSTAVDAILQLESTTAGGSRFTVLRRSNSSFGPAISLGKTGGSANEVVANNDILGEIDFAGGDGTDVLSTAAAIVCKVDGTPGSNDMPGRLVFSTTADGASSPTERMRISSNGTVDIAGELVLGPNSAPAVKSDTTGVTGADQITNMMSLTQAEYDAIATPDANTFYVITA